MWTASSANSSGRPRREGKGIVAPSASRASSGSAASSGVSKRPGAIVLTRIPRLDHVAGGREGQADDPALRGRVGDLADLAVVGRDRRGVDADAALAASSGSFSFIAVHASRSTLKVPIRFTLITLWKISRSWGPCLPAVRWAQPIPAQQTEIRSPPSAPAGGVDRRLDRLGLHHVALDEARASSPSSEASASPFSAFRSAITTEAPRSCRARAVAAPRPEAPPATSALCSLDLHGASISMEGSRDLTLH